MGQLSSPMISPLGGLECLQLEASLVQNHYLFSEIPGRGIQLGPMDVDNPPYQSQTRVGTDTLARDCSTTKPLPTLELSPLSS